MDVASGVGSNGNKLSVPGISGAGGSGAGGMGESVGD